MNPELPEICHAWRVAALERAALPEHACAECERWRARLELREGLLRTLPRVVAPRELEARSAQQLEADERRERTLRAVAGLGRVQPGAELDRAVEAAAAGMSELASRQRTPSVLDRLVAEELADPVKARVARQVEHLPRMEAPAALAERIARDLAAPHASTERRERRPVRQLWLAAAAALVTLAFSPLFFRDDAAPVASTRVARPFRVEHVRSTRDLSPAARAWLETASSGMLSQNNI